MAHNSTKQSARAIFQFEKVAEYFYVLSFESPPSAAMHEFHSLEVKVNKPGTKAQTNTVYYAES